MILLSVPKVQSSYSRGIIFEGFIKILLSQLGYKITGVRVRKSGCELDIIASSKITDAPMVIECKAHSKPIASPAFNEFYGKYEHENTSKKYQGKGLTGLMISLSGFNSEVQQRYDEKDETVKQCFKIWGPTDIIKQAVEAALISDDTAIKLLASKSWPFEMGNTLLVVSDNFYYRIQLLVNKDGICNFIVFRSKGEDASEEEILTLQQRLPILKNIEPFNLKARKEICLALANSSDSVGLENLKSLTKQSKLTIENEINYLKNRKLIEETTTGQYVLVRDIRAFAEISQELLDTHYKYDFLMSVYFIRMNTADLAKYCLSRRHLENSGFDVTALNRMFAFSPRSLQYALFGDIGIYNATYEHAQQIKADMKAIYKMQMSQMFSEMTPLLLMDLHNNKNKAIIQLPPVVCLLEQYHIAFGNSERKIFDIKVDSMTGFMRAGGPIKAGQLVSTDPVTDFNTALTEFRLTENEKAIKKMEESYANAAKNGIDNTNMAKLANNIGVSYEVIKGWSNARKWFEVGLALPDIESTTKETLNKNLSNLKTSGLES